MKAIFTTSLCRSFLGLSLAACALTNLSALDFLPSSEIYSGVHWFDTEGNPINCSGIGLLQVGSTYYMVGEKRSNKGFGIEGDFETNFIGISLYSSVDLINWKHLPDPLMPQDQTEISKQCIVERPKLLYNKANKEFILYLHTWSGSGNVCLATSPQVEGPYSYHGVLKFDNGKPVMGGDLGVFQDSDDTAYLLETEGNIYQLASDYKTALRGDLPRPITIGSTESPSLFKLGETYYYLCSQMAWWHNGDNLYATASSIKGPWIARGIICPPRSKTWNSQITYIQAVVGTRATTCIYMGDRWVDGNWLSGVDVWQPLLVNGTNLSMPEYHPSWKIDLASGLWTDVPDRGVSINHTQEGNGSNQIEYTGTWTTTPEKRRAGAFYGDYTYSNTTDDLAVLRFTGRRVRFYSVMDHSNGIIGLTLCDATGQALLPESTVDLYADASHQGNDLCYVSPLLPSNSYQLKVRVTGLKNHYAEDDYGVIDHFTVE